MTPDKTPTDAELWQLHMQLPGQHKDPIDFARAVLAKWGSPVVAGEPYAYAVYFPDQPCEELVHELDDLTEDLTNREHTITELYTTPQPTQAQAGAGDGRMSEKMRDHIKGMSVSVDVSTGDHDAGNRYFGTVTEVMDDIADKHGVVLLVQDAEPNFAPQPTQAQAGAVPLTGEQWQRITDLTGGRILTQAVKDEIERVIGIKGKEAGNAE